MTQKEKYNEALERARDLMTNQNPPAFDKDLISLVFPELAESEDERTRKGILELVRQSSEILDKQNQNNMIAWLEKQDTNKEYVFRPVAGTMIENAVEQALKQDNVVFAFNGFYTPVKGKTSDEILTEYDRWLEKQGEQKPTIPKWKYKKDHTPLLRDSLILNKYGCVAKSPSGAIVSDVWVLDYDELAKLPKEVLEKQGKQPTDKIKTKFKVRDWIANGGENPCYVKSIFGDYYELCSCEGFEYTKHIKDVDYTYHLWSINDANDGDVLVDEDNNIGLYSGEKDDLYWHSCIYLGCDNCLRGSMGYHKHKNTKPATKEQRELLFQKMKEEGYEWDNEKKELKMIAHKFNVGDWIVTDDSFGKIVRHVDEIIDNIIDKGYVVSDENGLIYNISFDKEHKWHKWTIQDAEDGDVLAVDPIDNYSFPVVAIYKERGLDFFNSYCCIGFDGKFYEGDEGHSIENIHPATKEQRDLLFSKMNQAGYELNSEKKELKRIEPKILGADDILPYLGNNQVQDILEDMGMLDDNGRCPYTAEEIFKAGMEYAFDLNREAASSVKFDTNTIIEKACEWLRNNWCDYVDVDSDGVVCFGHWENDFRKAMKGDEQ